ncbi:guanine deaminase [Ralstonia pseudosolanacearum]|uniref:guanine deaminase n=1 Tax=Ralstonia pseudosolanacearum TaxID=1310165 RepID=UPI00048CA88C|nr:guanine deaminase [Ralstonia pseudosolanacearum]MDO3559236.1 guanine deaminase [Ralstonia pseudosolanacearum]MDO3578896.1 guanine deaminase [Ralstonia pseudosolanacearum]MDO3588484.1 guanine deaminase [Ralstonia pseudosolanacearum]
MTTLPPAPDATLHAYRGRVLHFLHDPQYREHDAYQYWEDGLLVIAAGKVVRAGDHAALKGTLPAGAQVHDYSGKLIVPGFIDTHIHFPQTDIIASPSPGLLHWLETYTFPEERRFESPQYAAGVASFFLDELLRNGTTSAMVWSTVHRGSAETLFEQARARGMRLITGKVMMDRNCPEYLRDTAERGARDAADLIARWHGKDRLAYAITPRFAPTSSEAQLAACGELARQHPDVFIQTHVAENPDEVKWVAELFPNARSYLDVYDRYGLLRRGALYGHAIWLDDGDRRRMAESGAAVAHCPTSNLFLGSGLYNFHASDAHRLALTLATDVGGGSSFSMLRTMGAAHEVARMGGYHLSALRLFYLATRGAAEALGWQDRIGSFVPGAEADFIVLDPAATPLLARRNARAETLEAQLFSLALLGEDRAVAATYIQGEPAKFAVGVSA